MKKILIIILIFIVGLVVLRDPIIKTAMTTVGSHVIGAPLKVGKFSSSLIAQKVQIKDLKIYNPKGFPQEPFVDIPEITMQLNAFDLLKGVLHVKEFILNINEVVIVKDKDGSLNVDALKAAQQPEAKKETAQKPAAKKGKGKFRIDLVNLNINRVVSKDFASGTPDNPEIKVYDLGLKDKTFEHINSLEQLVALIMVQSISPTVFKGAKIYGAATILGVGFLPAGIAGILISKDDASSDFSLPVEKVFTVSLSVVKEMGSVGSEDAATGVIKGKVSGANVAIKIEATPEKKTRVVVSARKFLLPKKEIAAGVLRQIQETLK